MKKNYLLLLLFTSLFYQLSFGQVKLPISGTFKVTNDTYFNKVEVKENLINTFMNEKMVGTFMVLEHVSDTYIFEIVKPGTSSIDLTAKRDRRLMKIKVVKLTDDEYNFVITNPNGTTENVTLIK